MTTLFVAVLWGLAVLLENLWCRPPKIVSTETLSKRLGVATLPHKLELIIQSKKIQIISSTSVIGALGGLLFELVLPRATSSISTKWERVHFNQDAAP